MSLSNFRPYLLQRFRNRVTLLAGWVVIIQILQHSVVGLTWAVTLLGTLGILSLVVLSITLSSYQRHNAKF